MQYRSAYRTVILSASFAAAFAGLASTAEAQDACTQPQHATVGGVLVESRFDGGAEGWRIVENDPNDTPIVESGYITGEEGKGHATWFWLAPAAFLGDRSAAYGGSLSFDQVQPHLNSQTSDSSHVYLAGGGLAIRIDGLGNPGIDWTHYVVPLHECADWKNAETGEQASAQEIRQVLGSLEQLSIRGEYVIGDDQSSLDNVVLRAGVPAAPAPDFAFSTTTTPELAVSGEEATFVLVVKNGSPSRHLTDVSVDIVFAPVGYDPLRPAPIGHFDALNAICDPLARDDADLSTLPHGEVAHGYRCDIGALLAGGEQTLTFAQDKALAGETAYRFAASSKETGQASLDANETGTLGDNAGDGTITVVAGTIDLDVTIPPLGLETRTGERKKMVLTVTNKGNARLYQPALEIAFTGTAVPRSLETFDVVAGKPEDPESLEAPLELCQTNGATVRCVLVHAGEFSDGDAYLAPGETRQINLAFTPSEAGDLTLTARANGKNGFGERASGEFSQETTVIGPNFALTLDKTTPEATGTVSRPDGSERNLHDANTVVLHYSIYNGPDFGTARNVSFDVIAFDAMISSITSPSGAQITCDNKGDLASCVIAELTPGSTVTVDIALTLTTRPVYTAVSITGGGAAAEDDYWIGADVNLYALEDFTPGNRTEVFPGEEIVGRILVGANADSVDGAVLRIMQPTLEDKPSGIRIGRVDGCTSVEIAEASASCQLPTITADEQTEIAIGFNAVPSDEVGKTLTFAWELVLPAELGTDAGVDSEGELTYRIVPEAADLAISRTTSDGDVRPGDTQDLGFLVANLGPASQANVVAKMKIDVTSETALIMSGLRSFVHDVVAYVPSSEGNERRRVPCYVTGEEASCAIGTLEPGQSAEIIVTWYPRAITAGAYHYEAFVGEGTSESGDAGLLANNQVEGGGKIAGDAQTGYGGTWVGSVSVTEEVPVQYAVLAILREHDNGSVNGELRWTDSTGGSGTELVRGVAGNDACFELRGTAYQDQIGRGEKYELGTYTLCRTLASEIEISWRDDRFMTLKHP